MIVELRPAFVWDCDECGKENFCAAEVPELTDEDLEELRNDHGVQPWETGRFMAMPMTVACKFCHTEFNTRDDELDDEDD